jgi:DNA-binding NtrC family response regulator
MALLATSFMDKFCKKYQKPPLTLSDSALTKLNRHNWPGNIRELSHVIERAVLMASSNEITADQLLLEVQQNEQNHVVLQPLEVAEQQLIEKAMTVTQGNVIEAAQILEISRNALYRRLEKFANNDESEQSV